MHIIDFEYDGIRLSDLGYMVCTFGSQDMETLSSGGELTFNTVSILSGTKYQLTSSVYGSYLEATLQICKDPCLNNDGFTISLDEFRYLMRWLQRKGFHEFRPYCDENEYSESKYYYEGSFTTVERIEDDGDLVGIEMTLITNRPFALANPITIEIENDSTNGEFTIRDESDAEGFVYPHTEIYVSSSGNLSITNALEDRLTYIGNCVAGETITMDYPIIITSSASHKIQNDFNWNFLRLANTFGNNENVLTVSLPCNIQMSYSPSYKIGI